MVKDRITDFNLIQYKRIFIKKQKLNLFLSIFTSHFFHSVI